MVRLQRISTPDWFEFEEHQAEFRFVSESANFICILISVHSAPITDSDNRFAGYRTVLAVSSGTPPWSENKCALLFLLPQHVWKKIN